MSTDHFTNTQNLPMPEHINWTQRSGGNLGFNYGKIKWLWRPHEKQRGGAMWVYDLSLELSASRWAVVRLRPKDIADAETIIRDFYAGGPLIRFKPKSLRPNYRPKRQSVDALNADNQAYHDCRSSNAD